jgi:hypothetical protein
VTRRLLRAAALGVGGALAWTVLTTAVYSSWPALVLEMTHDRSRALRGVYPGERADRVTFAWTDERADIVLRGLHRNGDWTAAIRIRGARPDPNTLPDVTILVDGAQALTRRLSNEFDDVEVSVPASPGRRGLTLSLLVSPTFQPGPGDPRHLGAQIDRLVLRPAGLVLPPPALVRSSALAGGLFGLLFGWVASGAATAALGLTALGLVQAAILRIGVLPYVSSGLSVGRLAFWICASAGLGVVAIEAACRRPLSGAARFVVLCTASVLFAQLLVLMHPDKPIVDALFQAHRFGEVLAGNYIFTSTAPGGYQFPYAIGLYVAALPFARLTQDHVALLRVLVAVTHVVAAAAIYPAVVRAWNDRLTGALAVAITLLIPLGFYVQSSANLTNAFGQSLATLAMVAIVLTPAGPRLGPWLVVLTLLVSSALLSHLSTLATLSAMVLCTALLYWIRGDEPARRAGWRVALALGMSLVIAVGLYYRHFGGTYWDQLARITGEVRGTEPAGAPGDRQPGSAHLYASGGRSTALRAANVPRSLVLLYSWPVLILTFVGTISLLRGRSHDRLTLTIAGWTLGCVLFLVLGILTPIDMRHYLAAVPLVGIVAAAGASSLWRRAGLARYGAVLLLAWAVHAGIASWLGALAFE